MFYCCICVITMQVRGRHILVYTVSTTKVIQWHLSCTCPCHSSFCMQFFPNHKPIDEQPWRNYLRNCWQYCIYKVNKGKKWTYSQKNPTKTKTKQCILRNNRKLQVRLNFRCTYNPCYKELPWKDMYFTTFGLSKDDIWCHKSHLKPQM